MIHVKLRSITFLLAGTLLLALASLITVESQEEPHGHGAPDADKASEVLDIPAYSIDGGGGTSSGDDFQLIGSVGQPDAGTVLEGDDYGLTGGVMAVVAPLQGILFCDGFESGDASSWSSSTP